MFPWIQRLTAVFLFAAGALAQETPPAPAPAAPIPTAPAAPADPTAPALTPAAPATPPSAPAPAPAQPSAALPADAPPNLTVPPQGQVPTPPPAPAKPKLSPLAPQPDWGHLKALNGAITREEFTSAISEIYSDGSAEHFPWKLGASEVQIETTPGQKPVAIVFAESSAKKHETPRFWRSPRELPPLKPNEPVLSGLRIVLDPGHIGGAYAKMEERWLSMEGGAPVMEGSLVLQVAQLLKPRLEALGAQVNLVRSQEAPVTTAKPEELVPVARQVLVDAGVSNPLATYDGIKDVQRVATVQWQAEKLFYRVSEIRARAERVNKEFKPDLVLCLHLNAMEWGDPNHPIPSPENHFHLLINGCYAQDELQLEDVRYEMLQRLFSLTHVEEKNLAEPIARAMAAATGLPPFVYLTKNARRVSSDPYIYSRNLLANRLYECPVIYLEPYVMNNPETYRRLLLGHYIGRTLLDNHLVSSPLEDYARGVTAGLVAYYSSARHPAP